jgi:hypothetical protein
VAVGEWVWGYSYKRKLGEVIEGAFEMGGVAVDREGALGKVAVWPDRPGRGAEAG